MASPSGGASYTSHGATYWCPGLSAAQLAAAVQAAQRKAKANSEWERRLGVPPKVSEDVEDRAAAATEGAEFVTSSNATDFKVVSKNRGRNLVQVSKDGKSRSLGTFATPAEVASHYARHIGAARAAAEAAEVLGKEPQLLTEADSEGLELVPSSRTATGFMGVYQNGRKFRAQVNEDGKKRYVGYFSTPEEAALSYAQHIGAARAAAEAAEARGKGPHLLTAADARAAAAAEGLELVASSNTAGFRGVVKHGGKYQAKVREDGKQHHLGIFNTPEEAALCYARQIGAAQAAAEAAEARCEGLQPLTAAEARAAAAAEGLEFVPSSNATGFMGVFKDRGKYQAQGWDGGKTRYLGIFDTPEEAALCCARRSAKNSQRGKKHQRDLHDQHEQQPSSHHLRPQGRAPRLTGDVETVIIEGFVFRCCAVARDV